MTSIDTIIIGGGQAGLAMSACLRAEGIDHLILERGRVGERWRSERWDSLQLLTPNWMTRLPDRAGPIGDPDGFMSKDDLIRLLEEYSASIEAPVLEGVTVVSLHRDRGWFQLDTSAGPYTARNVVVATGQCGIPVVPGFSSEIDTGISQVHASRYRNPGQLAPGAVLVVGSGASGIQIAAELALAGRQVTLSVGRHGRAVRRYRGRDIWWWLDHTGSLHQTADEVPDLQAARTAPSLGLTGARGGVDIDLGSLQRMGVGIAGRLTSARGRRAVFADNAIRDAADADDRLTRLLSKFDRWATDVGLDHELDGPSRPLPVRIERSVVGPMDLVADGVGTVVWATGYRPSYPWMRAPVLDEAGEIVHDRGITAVPGLYVLGLRFQWRRNSHFIDGVGRDAEFLAAEITARAKMATRALVTAVA